MELSKLILRLFKGRYLNWESYSNRVQAIEDVWFMNNTAVQSYNNIRSREAKGDFSFSDFFRRDF